MAGGEGRGNEEWGKVILEGDGGGVEGSLEAGVNVNLNEI